MSSDNIYEENKLDIGDDTDKGVEFWKKYLEGFSEVVSIPKRNSNAKEYNEKKVSIELSEELTGNLLSMSNTYNLSLHSIILVIWSILLQRYSGCNDVIFGEIINLTDYKNSNDERRISLIPRRIKLNGGADFIDNVMIFSKQLEQCEKFKNTPFLKIVESTIFKSEILTSVIQFKDEDKSLKYNVKDVLQSQVGLSKCDLMLSVNMYKSIIIESSFNSEAYDIEFVKNLLKYFNEVCTKISEMHELKIDEIDILTSEDKKKILIDFNDTISSYDKSMTINRAFENQVKKTPDEIALKCNGIEISYDHLNRIANSLAKRLKGLGVKRNTIVPLICKRSIDMAAAMLGILKAGAAYLPIDPSYPSNRIEYMIEDSDADIIMTDESQTLNFKYSGQTLNISEYEEECILENIDCGISSSDLAYVIYTSGSTGKPKGVMIEHRSVYNFIEALYKKIDFQGKKILSLTTISFDIFVVEMLAALTKGIQVILATELQQTDIMMIGNLIFEEKINILQATPSRLKMIFEESANIGKLESITDVLSAGEAITMPIVNLVRSKINARLYDVYGPTETTVYSSISELTNENKVHIGKPMDNMQMYILDSMGRVVPSGVIGELYIGGDGLARGYYKMDELTKDRFRYLEFDVCGNKFNTRAYKTGDLARQMEDRNIEYLGRIDQQVKIRGYRIEIGEIESIILKYENINQAAVTDYIDSEGNKFLCAYIVSTIDINIKELRAYLLKYLPDYMIPTYFMLIDKIPLTPNNKLDRKALSSPSAENLYRKEYEAPKSDLERTLVNIWEEVFEISKIGVNDDFFDLGGYSLKAMKIVSKAKKVGINLIINDIFHHLTIKNIARNVKISSSFILNVESALNLLYNKYGIIGKCENFLFNSEKNTVLFIKSKEEINMDEVLSFMSENFDKDIMPHYIKQVGNCDNITNKNFQGVLGLRKISGQEIKKICESINIMVSRFEYKILSSKEISEFSMSPVQQYTIKNGEFDLDGMVIRFPGIYNLAAFNKAVHTIIKFQPLLRCRLKNVNGDLVWSELECPDKLHAATIDISEYDLMSKKFILDTIARKFYIKDFDLLNSLPFRILLVKLNIKESLVLIPFSHLIFDGQGGEIFKSKLMEYYNYYLHSSEEIYEKPLAYSDYVNLITRGPENIEDEELYKELKLNELYSGALRINKKIQGFDYSKPTFYEYVINKNDISGIDNEISPWSKTFNIVCQFCKKYFDESNIPIWIATYGRRYKTWSDFESIGEFIDSVPIMVNSDNDDMEILEKRVGNKIESLTSKNINICNLLFNKQAMESYPVTSSKVRSQMEKINIYFNFQGEYQEDERKIKDRFLSKMGHVKVKNITFTAWYTENLIYIRLMLPYKEEIEKIKSIFECKDKLNEDDIDICF